MSGFLTGIGRQATTEVNQKEMVDDHTMRKMLMYMVEVQTMVIGTQYNTQTRFLEESYIASSGDKKNTS